MYELLKYSDEVDKSLGVAGMAIALLACDGEYCLANVSIDENESTIGFAPEAFYSSNPRFSAKIAWTQLMREFNIFSGMLMGNVMCRMLTSNMGLNSEIIDMIHDLIEEHGKAKCSLEEDEIDVMFDKDMRYYHRIFSHPTVSNVARDLATTLRVQRRMSAGEVFEYLSRLSSL